MARTKQTPRKCTGSYILRKQSNPSASTTQNSIDQLCDSFQEQTNVRSSEELFGEFLEFELCKMTEKQKQIIQQKVLEVFAKSKRTRKQNKRQK